MKKLMCAIAAVSAGICLADVTSANIVGYNTLSELQASSAKKLYNMLSIPFTAVDGKGISLDDLVFSNGKSASMSGSADQIKLWVLDENGVYTYQDWYHSTSGWKGLSDSIKGLTCAQVYPNGLEAGTVFWYVATKRAVAGTYTTSGAVDSEVSVTRTIKRDSYNFVSYPYPTPLKLNDSNSVDWGAAAKSSMSGSADKIYLWVYDEASGEYTYEIWYVKSSGWVGLSDAVKNKTFEDVYPNGVKVGTGFWYVAKSKSGSESFDITFKSPLEKSAE